jgi:hypothetical protein
MLPILNCSLSISVNAPFVFFTILNPLVSTQLAFAEVRSLKSEGDGGGDGMAKIEPERSDIV